MSWRSCPTRTARDLIPPIDGPEPAALEVAITNNDWHTFEGASSPLGVSHVEAEDAFNFALYSKHGNGVELLLYRDGDFDAPIVSKQLDPLVHRSHRIWHCRLKRDELHGARYYAYRISGPPAGDDIGSYHRYDPSKILLDPYAKAVFFPPDFSREAATRPGANDGRAPLGVIEVDQAFEWGEEADPDPGHDLIVYEMHVRQFTAHPNSGVPAARRGTYQGVIDKIPHLQELGVTAVELMPVHQCDPQEGSHWGYMTLDFFAPHRQYASGQQDGDAVREFKQMVKALHDAGIQVILDVVFNHTTEGNEQGPTYSYKGIDNSTYYLAIQAANGQLFFNNATGTGNTVHAANQHVSRLVLDSLRYWRTEMHVDGFRFDLASIFARDSAGNVDTSNPIFPEISTDPVLQDTVLIAEPWDLGSYMLGKAFPGLGWRQWNDKYRDEVKGFIKGDSGLIGKMLTRLYGSDDLFPGDASNANHAYESVNYLASHDGLTLYDSVSYTNNSQKSWNCGFEGVENVPVDVMALRKQQIKNYVTWLVISNGTPMFRAGDEFLQTQFGKDNPYNVDDESVWMDWSRLDDHRDVFEFFKGAIAFRKRHPSLGRSRFWRTDVSWYGPGGDIGLGSEDRALAFQLRGSNPEFGVDDVDIYVMINTWWGAIDFGFQQPGPWARVINTALAAGNDLVAEGHEMVQGNRYTIGPRSMAVFVKPTP